MLVGRRFGLNDRELVLFLVQWIVAVPSQYVTGCLHGWTPNARVRACYKLYDNVRLDWADARAYCTRQNAFLSDMLDFNEQKFINDSLLAHRYIEKGVWLGATDRRTGNWRWVDDSPMDIDLYLWRKGNPNNGEVFIEIPDLGQDCLQMSTEVGTRGRLNDYYCRRQFHFVCKSTDTFIQSTTDATTEMNHKPSLETGSSKNTTTVTVGALVAAIVLVSAVIAVLVIIYRRRKRLRMTTAYQDRVGFSNSEHVYTGLDAPGINNNSAEPNDYETVVENSSLNTADHCNIYQPVQMVNQHEHMYAVLDADLHNQPNVSTNDYTDITEKANNSTDAQGKGRLTHTSGYMDMESNHYEEPDNKQFASRGSVSREFAMCNEGFVSDNVEPDCKKETDDCTANTAFERGASNQNTYYITPCSQETPYYITPTSEKPQQEK